MLSIRVIVATHSRRSEHPTKDPHPERPSEAEGFFSVVSSTDHHPLNTAHFLPSPLPSLLPIPCPLFSNSFPCHTSKNSPVSPAIATLPKLAFITPVFATHPRAPQGVPTPNVPAFNLSAFQRYLTYPLFFHTLAHYFALTKSSTRLFSSASALLAKNHPGGEGVLLTDRLLTPSGGSHGFIHVAAGLFAGITLSLITALKILKIILENFCARLAQAFSGGLVQCGFCPLLGRAIRMLTELHDSCIGAPIVLILPLALSRHLPVKGVNQKVVCPQDEKEPGDAKNHEPLEHAAEPTPSPKFIVTDYWLAQTVRHGNGVHEYLDLRTADR